MAKPLDREQKWVKYDDFSTRSVKTCITSRYALVQNHFSTK